MSRGWTDDALFAAPGRVYSYASPGFWLAGHVLAEVGGKPYADMMTELVFAPLGMTRTTLRPLAAMTWPLALGHQLADGRPEVIRSSRAPTGSASSCSPGSTPGPARRPGEQNGARSGVLRRCANLS